MTTNNDFLAIFFFFTIFVVYRKQDYNWECWPTATQEAFMDHQGDIRDLPQMSPVRTW
jgi:hypothetical protein